MTREEEFLCAQAQRHLAEKRARLEAHARYLAEIDCQDQHKLMGLEAAFAALALEEARS